MRITFSLRPGARISRSEPRLLAARKGDDAAMDAFMSHVEVAGEASAVQGAML